MARFYCTPGELRKALVAVDTLKRCGLDFVPVPVWDEHHKKKLVSEANNTLERIRKEIEEGDKDG